MKFVRVSRKELEQLGLTPELKQRWLRKLKSAEHGVVPINIIDVIVARLNELADAIAISGTVGDYWVLQNTYKTNHEILQRILERK
jgi:hypothetical protein